MRKNHLLAVAVAVLLGCGSTHADDQKPDEPKPAPEKKADEKKPDDKKAPEKKPERRFVATVKDRFGTEPFAIEDAEVLVPQVSLLGGESFDHKRSFQVKHGAAEIEVPFDDVSKVTFGATKEDRLDITIEFRAAEKADKELKGTVKSNLQLGGKYQQRGLEARLKLREVETVTLEEQKAK